MTVFTSMGTLANSPSSAPAISEQESSTIFDSYGSLTVGSKSIIRLIKLENPSDIRNVFLLFIDMCDRCECDVNCCPSLT